MSLPQEPTDRPVATPASTDSSAPAPPDSAPPEELILSLPDESTSLKDIALWAGVLVILTLVAFWPATEGRFLVRDDENVSENLLLARPGGLGTIWSWQDGKHYPLPQYHPVTMSSYWLEYHLFGRDERKMPTPFSYHVTNLLLHAGAAVMLWLVLRWLKLPAAWLAAAVFALHPVNTEAAAWISQRASVLAGLLFFASIYTYLLFADEDHAAQAGHPTDPGRQWVLYAGSLLLFALAMLSKSTAFAMPFVVLLILWWRHRFTARLAVMLLPFAVIAFVLAFMAADFERDRYGLAGAEWNMPFIQRLVLAGRAIWFYVAKLLAPVGLTFLYPRWSVGVNDAAAFVPIAAVALVILGLALAIVRVGRGPLVAMGVFIACLLPALGLVNMQPMKYTFVADHYAYLAGAALVALVVSALAKAVRRARSASSSAGVSIGLSAILLVALGAASWVRAHVFVDSVKLWSDTVVKNRDSAYAHGRYAAALGAAADAAIASDDADNYPKLLEAALVQARQAAELDPKEGDHEWVQGQVLVRLRKPDEAVAHLQRATQLDPRMYQAWQDLAGVLLAQKKWQGAIDACDAALRVQPNSGPTHRMLGDAYVGLNEAVRATAEFRTALQMKPDDLLAREHMADLLAKTDQKKEAIFQFTLVLQAQRERADLWYKVAVLYAARGDMGSAIKFFEQAIALKPDFEEAKRDRMLAIGALEKERQQAATRAATLGASLPTTAP